MKKVIALCLGAALAAGAAFANGEKDALSSGAVRITVEVFDRGTDGGKSDPANNEWTKWIKAKVLADENIDVTFVPVNRWSEETSLVTMMAANNAPTLCCTYSIDNVRNWGRQGGVYDLSPYVDTLLKDAQALFGEDRQVPGQNFIWHNRLPDTGALYGISNVMSTPGRTGSHNTFIRKDWLDTLGLPAPTTTQQFYNTLAAFRDNAARLNPGGQVIPFIMSTDVRWQAYNIFVSFMPSTLNDKERWVNTVAERQLVVPGVKEAYRWLNKLYNEGLIARDFPLYKDDTEPANLLKSGAVGAFQHNWDQPYRQNLQIQTELAKNVPGAKFIPIDPFTNDKGAHPKRGHLQDGGLISFVPASAGDAERDAALRYYNWLSKYENYHFLQFGKEGVNHQTVDGVELPIPAAGAWIQNSGINVDYTLNINGYAVPGGQAAQVLAAGYAGIPPEDISAAARIASVEARPEPYVGAVIDSLAALRQTIVEKEQTFSVSVIVARPQDFDKVWEEGLREWLASGAQRVIDEQRAKYR